MFRHQGITKQVYQIFYLYFFVYYLFPFCMSMIYPKAFSRLFIHTDSHWPIIYVFIFFLLVRFLNVLLPKRNKSYFKKLGFIFENKKANIFIFSVFLIASIRFGINYNLNFRHSGNTIGESGSFVMIMFGLRSYVKIFFLYLILKYANNLKIENWQRIFTGIGSFSLLFTIVASLDFLWAFFGLLILLKKEIILFDKTSNMFKKLRSQAKKIALLIFIAFIVVFVGNANKVGTDKAWDSFTTENIENIFVDTSVRLSVWYVSVVSLAEQNVFNNKMAFETLGGILNNLYSRFGILFGHKENEIEGVWSVKRMNYLNIYQPHFTHNPITGSSPGLVASSFYLPFFPINFLVLVTYTVFILRYFSKGFKYIDYRFNFFAMFLLLFYFNSLIDSPIDLINFIGPAFIFVFFFLVAMDQIENMNRLRLKEQI